MSASTVRACLRCHAKKIKCSGFPDCRNCMNSGTPCERHTRPRKTETIEALRQARQRIQWLEEELQNRFQIDCHGVATGTPLPLPLEVGTPLRTGTSLSPTRATAAILTGLNGASRAGSPARTTSDASAMSTSPRAADMGSEVNDAPEISILALNATGETKYLGPSSGAFFATYATRLARSLMFTNGGVAATPKNTERRRPQTGSNSISPPSETPSQTVAVSLAHIRLLFRSYLMWVHPLYPLLHPDILDSLVAQVGQPEVEGRVHDASHYTDMAMFYLVMALGATNYANTLKQLQNDSDASPGDITVKPPSPPHLYYAQALHYFNQVVQDQDHMETSVAVIQIVLLISIYSSYGQGPIGSSQWQLAGMAMRMAIEIGLHHEPRQVPTSTMPNPDQERMQDQRRRVFWTAYVIDISLAYNLGRPPSIGEEHITVRLPRITREAALGIHHVRHRQIQSRIVSHVYAGGRVSGATDAAQTVTRLQGELDAWRAELASVLQFATDEKEVSSYPSQYWHRLYYGTTFVLHRASPLCPQPSAASLEQCVRAAGAYLDCMLEVVRNSHVPLSWMLVQGVLFAGLSMLITARTRFQTLSQHAAVRLLLVDLPMWTRRCSICLAVMNERWSLNRSRNRSEEDLLSQLERQFEALAGDTLSLITAAVLGEASAQPDTSTVPMPMQQASVTFPAVADITQSDPRQQHQQQDAVPRTSDDPNTIWMDMNNDWDHMQDFREFLGIDGACTFWDIFPTADGDFVSSEQQLESETHFATW